MNAIDGLRARFSIAIISVIWLNCALLVTRAFFATDASATVVVGGVFAIAAVASAS